MHRLDPAAPPRGYAICTTQRSGSNYLCQLLASTGRLGNPLDYFNAAGRRAKGWAEYPDDVNRQLDLIVPHGSTPNGVYGFKAFASVLDALASARWTERLPDLRTIYLRRGDLLAQAISLVIAEQTGKWRSTGTSHAAPAYDAPAIARTMATIARDDAAWRLYFANNGVQPLEITYEALVDDPQRTVAAVAALLSLDGPAIADPARVEVEVQRDEINRAWHARFLAERARVPALAVVRRPRLTVSVITRDSAARLPRLLAEAREYADEIVVGVDASSADDTLGAAERGADTVYRFALAQPGQLAPARLLPFDYATGDWILSLDDDESMEPSFDALLPELMAAGAPTHYYFPRKWIVGDDPYEYVHAPPWFPNWAPRMFRNDRSLVWKPPTAHSMYMLLGPVRFEERTSILHFEPLWCAPDERRRKLEAYRRAGAHEHSEEYYAVPPDARRRRVSVRPAPAAPSRATAAVVHRDIHQLTPRQMPPWSATFVRVDMPAVARPGETFVVQATLRNSGELAWAQQYAQWPANPWPMLRLSYALFHEDGAPADPHEGHRTLLPRFVAPGDEVTYIDHFTAPQAPGAYVVAWDMISEFHCWFAACGDVPYRTRLSVRAE